MCKKMKGFIDPLTLGFIIALAGGATAVATDKLPNSDTAKAKVSETVVVTAAIKPEKISAYDEE